MDENYEKRGYLLEDFRLFHLKDDRGTKVDYHYHEFCKIVLLLSGSGSYTVDRDTETVLVPYGGAIFCCPATSCLSAAGAYISPNLKREFPMSA